MNLAGIFTAVAHKRLTSVDLPARGSNQHELNGTTALRSFFGVSDRTRGTIFWHRFADEEEPIADLAAYTFYDARAKSAERTGRSEWRFYYEGDFLAQSNAGDTAILARTRTGKVFGLLFAQDSSWLRAAKTLFGITDSSEIFDELPDSTLSTLQLQFVAQQILHELGLEVVIPPIALDENIVSERFKNRFPTTREMSAFARTQVEVDIYVPDATLLRWLEREEELFRALEKCVIGNRLTAGFDDVDAFIEYSLSVLNRRKARMGFALQNHLQELFDRRGLRYSAQVRTEGSNRPDFIFPGEREYHDPKFPARSLVMLGVKSTSKDRWRQVLTEADRVPDKHLCTLETSISTKQTDEMRRQRLTLVVPQEVQSTYTEKQRCEMLNISDFIGLVRANQP